MNIDSLVEELILLDEIAGELSDEDNARVDARRMALKQQIQELQKDPLTHQGENNGTVQEH